MKTPEQKPDIHGRRQTNFGSEAVTIKNRHLFMKSLDGIEDVIHAIDGFMELLETNARRENEWSLLRPHTDKLKEAAESMRECLRSKEGER